MACSSYRCSTLMAWNDSDKASLLGSRGLCPLMPSAAAAPFQCYSVEKVQDLMRAQIAVLGSVCSIVSPDSSLQVTRPRPCYEGLELEIACKIAIVRRIPRAIARGIDVWFQATRRLCYQGFLECSAGTSISASSSMKVQGEGSRSDRGGGGTGRGGSPGYARWRR